MMLDFSQKRKFRSLLYNWITIGILAIIVLFFLHSTWSVYKKDKESEQMKQVSLQNVEELRARNENLQTKIDRLATPEGVEEEIRSKFSVAKENENMVLVVESEQNLEQPTTTEQVTFWQRIRSFFGN